MIPRPSPNAQALARGKYAKTKEGLWVRSLLVDDDIVVSWRTRHVLRNGVFLVLDANGDVYQEMTVVNNWLGWVEAGRITMDNNWDFVGEATELSDIIAGIIRHTVMLITHGWGDSPEEVVSWFWDLLAEEYIVPGPYSIVEPLGPFEGLVGSTVKFSEENGQRVADMVVGAREKHRLDLDEIPLRYFLMGAEPA